MTTCTHPKTAWYKRASGEKLRFTLPAPHEIDDFDQIPIPCNKCDKCQASYAISWSVRCAMEMHMHDQNTFITLTYAEVDDNPTLKPEDMTNFMKRLRKYVAKNNPQELYPDPTTGDPELEDKKIRFIQCGEYGDKYQRPHHHAIIFGYDFPDLQFIGKSNKGEDMFSSQILTDLWGFGHCVVQNADIGTATYIAGYITKKIYGTKDADGKYISGGSKNSHYSTTNKDTGEIYSIHKEYMTMSRMPGLGHSFFEKYLTDMFPSGDIHLKNSHGDLTKFTVPQYFYRKLAEIDPELYLQSQQLRQERGIKYEIEQPQEKTPERRRTKAFITKKAQVQKGRPVDGINPSFHVDMTTIDKELTSDKHYQERLFQQKEFEQKYKNRLQSNKS